MKGVIPFAIIVFFLVLAVVSIFGEGGYSHLTALRESLGRQDQRNTDRQEYVDSLRREVYELEKDDRVLEKAAREHLGMARANEQIFFFEEQPSGAQNK